MFIANHRPFTSYIVSENSILLYRPPYYHLTLSIHINDVHIYLVYHMYFHKSRGKVRDMIGYDVINRKGPYTGDNMNI